MLNGKKQHHGVFSINYRTVARIGEITAKLHGLAFVHQQVAPLASVIDDALAFMPKSVDKDLGLLPGQFLNLIACLEAMGDQHELLARLRDKQPLVVVSQMPPILVANGAAQTTPVVAAPAVTQAVATATAVVTPASPTTSVVEDAAETEASNEVEVEATPAGQSNMFGLGFMANSLFD